MVMGKSLHIIINPSFSFTKLQTILFLFSYSFSLSLLLFDSTIEIEQYEYGNSMIMIMRCLDLDLDLDNNHPSDSSSHLQSLSLHLGFKRHVPLYLWGFLLPSWPPALLFFVPYVVWGREGGSTVSTRSGGTCLIVGANFWSGANFDLAHFSNVELHAL